MISIFNTMIAETVYGEGVSYEVMTFFVIALNNLSPLSIEGGIEVLKDHVLPKKHYSLRSNSIWEETTHVSRRATSYFMKGIIIIQLTMITKSCDVRGSLSLR